MSLIVAGLSVRDGSRLLLRGVNLAIHPGKITAVIGANGSGKSELVLAIAGVLPVSEGEVSLDHTSLLSASPETIRRAGVAAVPEGHRVLTELSVDENLRLAGALLRDDLSGRLASVYATFPELAERRTQLAGTLSGGQQQMVALAHALMCRPRYLLIDEMSLGLAPLIVKRLLGVVAGLRDQGVGILLIEQFTDLALGMADTAIVLRNGTVRYSGSARDLEQSPSLLQEAYFGA